MKIDINVITITSFKEARMIAYAPLNSDYRLGCFPSMYAARLAGIPESKCEDFNIEFSVETIAEYFDSMIACEGNHKLANVDFTTGMEQDVSWWGCGVNCISREQWSDPRPIEYLRVVKHVIETGYDSFEFEFFEDHRAVTEACKITKKRGGMPFIIARILDPNMYDGIVDYVEEQEEEKQRKLTATTADAFING